MYLVGAKIHPLATLEQQDAAQLDDTCLIVQCLSLKQTCAAAQTVLCLVSSCAVCIRDLDTALFET